VFSGETERSEDNRSEVGGSEDDWCEGGSSVPLEVLGTEFSSETSESVLLVILLDLPEDLSNEDELELMPLNLAFDRVLLVVVQTPVEGGGNTLCVNPFFLGAT
jgi:hypothetical protein